MFIINNRLRRKFLEKSSATLKDMQAIARAHEAVEVQMKWMDQRPTNDQVNVVKAKPTFHKRGRGNGADNRGNKLNKIPAKKNLIVINLVIFPVTEISQHVEKHARSVEKPDTLKCAAKQNEHMKFQVQKRLVEEVPGQKKRIKSVTTLQTQRMDMLLWWKTSIKKQKEK